MIATDAKCTVCGGPTKVAFSTGRAFKYCSDACRSRARNVGTWNDSPPAIQNRLCQHCGAACELRSITQKYCSDRCLYEHSRDKQAARRRAVAPKVHCQRCGKHIEKARANQKYCSPECRDTHLINRRQRGRMHECKGCGKVFKARYKRGYCSEECNPSSCVPVKQVIIQCKFCGDDFTATPNRKYCSPRCGRKYLKQTRKHIERARNNNRRYEPINPQRVFERDSWLCGICLAPVDRDTVVPAPLAATLDHIVPLSRGGHHELSNVRCAHFMCNSIKSGNLDEEIIWQAADPKHQRTS